jgi:surfactin synthase thioesterase subunit
VPGWLRCLTPRPEAAIRLICLPHAGGTAAFFGPWQRSADEGVRHIEVHVVQYPGRADRIREAAIDDAAALAAQVADAVAALADRPMAFFGHSMGALIGYEAARLLARHGLGPRHLMVSASPPPGHRDPEDKKLSTLDDERLVAALGRFGGSDPRLLAMPELLELILPAVRADFRLVERYVHRPVPMLDCPVTAYAGGDDRIAPAQLMQGWSGTTLGPFAARTYPGGHFYLQDRSAAVLADVAARLTATCVTG